VSRLVPAWSLPSDSAASIDLPIAWPERPSREWAFGGSTAAGVRVCILDSGVDPSHPLVSPLDSAVAIELTPHGETRVTDDELGDVCGHGTACAGVVRSLAPDCSLHSVRVLGAGATGSGDLIIAGLNYAVEQGFDVINMSLSTTKRKFAELLHELADGAYFRRTVIVAAAHNMPVESFPWRFSSVVSVGSHEEPDPWIWYANPSPPVEFFARGIDVEVAWPGGGTMRCTGNSFAAPHVAGLCALALGKHPQLTAVQLKALLYLTATNAGR
jgi:subtilisin family serine protease